MMKLVAIGVITCLALSASCSSESSLESTDISETIDIAVVFQRVPVDSNVYACLWSPEDSFPVCDMRNPHFSALETPHGVAAHVFRKIPPGIYAAGGYVDQNDNGQLDVDRLGVPTEPFAVTRSQGLTTSAEYPASAFEFARSASLTFPDFNSSKDKTD